MAKRKKGSKVQSRAKLRRANSAKRGKARKVAKAVKRTAAKSKPKRTPVKKTTPKERKQPIASVVDTGAVEHPAPEFEEVNKVSPGPDEPAE
jgi:hypothetical protein